jgi:hypothetical protein
MPNVRELQYYAATKVQIKQQILAVNKTLCAFRHPVQPSFSKETVII